jgi:Tfp pilus assembly protein PilF
MTNRLWSCPALVLVLACGGPGRGAPATPAATPKLPRAKPEALVQFDAAMRAMRLGGPEAHDQAMPRLERAVKVDPSLWEAWHDLGVIQFERGDDDAAAEAFGRALAVNPASIATLLGRAEAHRRAGRWDEARDDYRRALSRAPEDAAVHLRLASLLRESGRLEDALEAAREALRNERAPAILVELGMIYLAQGRDELAELVLRKAVAADAKLPAAWNGLALVALARSDDQEAFEYFDRASALDPGYRDARFNKASVLMSAGDYAAAQSELATVVNQDPEDHDACVALGVALRGSGELVKARREWERVVERAPQHSRARADALFNLAVLTMDFGDRDPKAARAALDRYLQQSPRRHDKREQATARLKELGQ